MVSVGTLVDRARIYCREILVKVPVRDCPCDILGRSALCTSRMVLGTPE